MGTKFKTGSDGKEREIPDGVFNAINENPRTGDYRSPQEWGVDGLTWERDWNHLTIFDDKIFIWRTIADFDEPREARRQCRYLIRELKKKGIRATMDEMEEGHNSVDVWLKTGKKFEELTVGDIREALRLYEIFVQL